MVLGTDMRDLDIGNVCEEQCCPGGGEEGDGEEDGILAPDSFRGFAETKLHSLGETEASGLEGAS